MRTADALQIITRALTPHVGETMARTATLAHCRKLGIGEPFVQTSDVERLLQGLSNGLNVFVGKARSAEAVRSAWEALAEMRDSK